MLPQFLYWTDPATKLLLESALKEDKVSIVSTDTVFGFLAPLTLTGYNKLDYLKKRLNKPYLVLIADKNRLRYFTDQILSPELEGLITACWPGPITLIFKARAHLPSYLKGPNDTIALRVPHHAGLLGILRLFPGLFSTSANVHNEPIPESIDKIDPHILETIEYVVVDDASGMHPSRLPSTLLDCTQDQIRVIRVGAYSIDELEAIYGAEFVKPLT